MSRGEYARVKRAYFRAVHRMIEARTVARSRELLRLASALAERLAGHDLPNLFGGI